MNLHALLARRVETTGPIRVGLIGAGKFGTMFLAQVPTTPGLHVVGIADLAPDAVRARLAGIGWPAERLQAADLAAAREHGTTHVGDDALALIERGGLDVVIEATGNPIAGLRHAEAAIRAGVHVVMVSVEADVLAGPVLARAAERAGVVYSLAYGDQPALIAEQVDWARATGFEVVCAGKGTKYLPNYHAGTPEEVWPKVGLSAERAAQGGLNAKMFNSFYDGTKSGIEMAAVANATGLAPPPDGLLFPPCGVDDLPHVLRSKDLGGLLDGAGTVEVVSSLERDGRPVFRDLRFGVYVVFRAPSAYVARCFEEYGVVADATGEFVALYRPYHLIGLELGISVLSAALRGEATGAPIGWQADVVATAKRDLAAGELLDGEGGATVWGKIVPAARSVSLVALPIGLAHEVRLRRSVAEGAVVRREDVEALPASDALRLRDELEASLANARAA
jgi:predicted homoserine dehydrogenase-like protein